MKRQALALAGVVLLAGLLVLWNSTRETPRAVTARIVAVPNASEFAAREARIQRLEEAVKQSPDAAGPIRSLALEYALVLHDEKPGKERVEDALERASNVWVLGNTAYLLQSLYNQGLQMSSANDRARKLAEHYFERAKALDPNLERSKILPQIDLQQIAAQREADRARAAAMEGRVRASVGHVRRLPVSAFSQLPETVARVLAEQGCTVPQTSYSRELTNVVRGEFVNAGATGWAVLCSNAASSAILVFRDDRDSTPLRIAEIPDERFVYFDERDELVYARGIARSEIELMRDRAQRYGGEQPRVFEHIGIEDFLLEKGSSVWYDDRGKWLQLPGSD